LTDGVKSLVPGEEKAQGGLHHSISILQEQLQRGERVFLEEATGRRQGAMGASCTERGFILMLEIFYSGNNLSL